MKIVFLDAYTANPGDLSWDKFKEFGTIEVYDYTPPELVIERCTGADVIIDNKVILNAEILSQLPDLKYIGMLSTGFNVIDTEYAKKAGIVVSNVPTYSTSAVAQLTFALILEAYNQVGIHNKAVHDGEWTSCRDFCFQKTPLVELYGKTIGLIGYGKIGSEVAKIADAFSMNILCYVPSVKPQPDFRSFKFVSLDELARESDIVSLHCPLTPATTNIINADFIAKMKKSAIIINTARGQSIDEKAVAEAINSGKIAGAGVDVLSTEPPKADNPLLSCEKCFITPHIAWAGYETRERLIGVVYGNLKAFIEGNPINVVNK